MRRAVKDEMRRVLTLFLATIKPSQISARRAERVFNSAHTGPDLITTPFERNFLSAGSD